ncbi:kinase-like protein, partial [Schizopora paradoxa]
DLLGNEIWWRERSDIIEDHGYQLRSRLRRGWVPSWQDTRLNLNPFWCEDSVSGGTFKVIDAIRKSDKKDVALMILQKDCREGEIYRHLTDLKRLDGNDHHIVPLLDSFQDDRLPEQELFVMPLLHKFQRPPFVVVKEVLDLFEQLLEGLVYMHGAGVAHRDCTENNILMDAPSMFPRGFHPCSVARDRSGNDEVVTIPRYKAAGPVRYYFIDFGISRRYSENEIHAVVGDDEIDREIPETSDIVAFDPFPADIFIFGNTIRRKFLAEYRNLDFLIPLVDLMTEINPSDRPSAADALTQLRSISAALGFFQRRRFLLSKDDG